MRKSTRFVRAFVAASVLTGMMVIGTPIHASGGMSDGNTFACSFALGIINRVPVSAGMILRGVFDSIAGCSW